MSTIVTALQAALDAINEAIPAGADDGQQLVAAKCRGLIAGYDAMWLAQEHEILSVEETLESELLNPDTGRKSQTFSIAGKLDVRARRAGRSVIFDHKTTSQDIQDHSGPYWRQLTIEGQVSQYMLLEWQNGNKIDEAVWDVIRKPGISPKTLSKAVRISVVSTRKYCGRKMSAATLEAMQTEDRENLEMYEARLADDCTNDRPEWYFQRKTIPRLDGEMLEYARELWEHGQDILRTRNRTEGENLPPRNSGACLLYGVPCKFLGICSGHDEPGSGKWKFKDSVHNELPLLQREGRSVLTNSRVRCFQTCRRKHYYEYELGIERYDEEEREALFFGSTIHLALEAWFRCFISQEIAHDDCDESSSANGAERHSSASETIVAG